LLVYGEVLAMTGKIAPADSARGLLGRLDADALQIPWWALAAS
jgi:hypothetical protein